MKLQEIHKSILQYASYDDVGLWEIIREISENDFFSPTIPDWVRNKALRVIEELIEGGLLVAGTPNGPSFLPFPYGSNELKTFIENGLDEFGHNAHKNVICWFRITPKGEQLVRDLGFLE